MLSGGSIGSPFDPSDALVIPFGMVIAIWTWRRPTASAASLRIRLALLAAGIAAFATVAAAPIINNDDGLVGYHPGDGALVLNSSRISKSTDGGLSWHRDWDEDKWYGFQSGDISMDWGGDAIQMPRGIFFIQGSHVIHESDSRRETAYSPSYLQNGGNARFQGYLDFRFGCSYRCPSSTLLNLVYHPPTGNVIASTANQGVVVGTSDGNWKQVFVDDRLAPPDFSLSNKYRVVLSDPFLWLTAALLSISFIAAALLFARTTFTTRGVFGRRGNPILVIGLLIVAILSFVTVLRIFERLLAFLLFHGGGGGEATLFLSAGVIFSMLLVMLAISFWLGRGVIGHLSTVSAVIASVIAVATLFIGTVHHNSPYYYQEPLALFESALMMGPFWACIALLTFRPSLRQLPVVIATSIAMIALFILAFVIGVVQGFNLTAAKIYAVILILIASFTLWLYLRRSNNIPTLPEDIIK